MAWNRATPPTLTLNHALFVLESWQARPDLTLQLGGRYEFQGIELGAVENVAFTLALAGPMLRQRRLCSVFGDLSSGGPNIINYVSKSLVAMLDWRMDAQAAAGSPNFGSRNGPTLIERGSFYESLRNELEKRGHSVEASPLVSGVHAVERIPGGWRGGADPRREGAVRGR